MVVFALATVVASAPAVKHVIILMEENRSFDHMFGWMSDQLHTRGLSGKECNHLDSSNTSSPTVCVAKQAPYVNLCDPDHGTVGTSRKIFGTANANGGKFENPTMQGFIEVEGARHGSSAASHRWCNVLDGFPPGSLPVAAALASEFAVFDAYFASHPGPTWPNRYFALSATSAGNTATGVWYHDKDGALYPQKTIFDQVAEAGLEWRNYYVDTPWELQLQSLANGAANVRQIDELYADAAAGTLPAYAWINPRSGINVTTMEGSDDQHPDHDVALGEALIKRIYEALRAGPAWNETAFVVMYDEHGGFYDHVPPPQDGVPAPGDGEASYPDKFNFTRLGIRLPFIVASPLIPRGTVVSEPPAAQRPQPTSQYEHTSVMATARTLLGMPPTPLTKRDAWAATFEHIFSLASPRDTPATLPNPPPPAPPGAFADEAARPLTDLQDTHATALSGVSGLRRPSFASQGDLAAWYRHAVAVWRRGGARREAAGTATFQAATLGSLGHSNGLKIGPLPSNAGAPATVSLLGGSRGCLTCGDCADGSVMGFDVCGGDAATAQGWWFDSQSALRWAANPHFCVTGHAPAVAGTLGNVTLQLCDGSVGQHWAWHPEDRLLMLGDDTWGLGAAPAKRE